MFWVIVACHRTIDDSKKNMSRGTRNAQVLSPTKIHMTMLKYLYIEFTQKKKLDENGKENVE